MKKYVAPLRLRLFALALIAVAAPAQADAHSFYIGLEGGVTFGRDNDVDELVSSPSKSAIEFDDVLSMGYQPGHDIGIAGGYAFGSLRLELEVTHKRASLKPVDADENFGIFIDSLNATGQGGTGALTVRDFDLPGKMRSVSTMINGLVDVGIANGISFYGGGGVGRSWNSTLGDKDSATAWQWIVGFRYAINGDVELGLKHRYFNSGIIRLQRRPLAYPSNVTVIPEIEGEFRSRSLLATLHFNLRGHFR